MAEGCEHTQGKKFRPLVEACLATSSDPNGTARSSSPSDDMIYNLIASAKTLDK
jgi:hypothetical protein